jgi:ABC-type lipoprotein export system ATPase subunit
MELVVAENITKDYRTGEVTVRALKGASFSIEPASLLSFVGPSGSGKTTLLNLIGCFDKPSGGRLLVAGMDMPGFGKPDAAFVRDKNIGFIFQDFNLIPVLTVLENIEYPLLFFQQQAFVSLRVSSDLHMNFEHALPVVGLFQVLNHAQIERPESYIQMAHRPRSEGTHLHHKCSQA